MGRHEGSANRTRYRWTLARSASPSPLSSGLLIPAALSVLSVIALGCSSTKGATPTTLPGSSAPSATTPTTSITTPTTAGQPSTTAATTSGLSGTWSGQYAGVGQGTFTLTWQQSGSALAGTIKLSSDSVGTSISGTVQGNAIRFGSVGSGGVTYTGSVSGNTMSGTYQAGSVGSGTWNATKTS